jgi:hypothetical protein
VHLPHSCHLLWQYSSHHRLRVQPSGVLPTPVSRSAWSHSSPTDGSGELVVADAVGISTWRAGAPTLWITSVEDIAASTYDFHATHSKTSICKNRFHMFTWLIRIPNTYIYMSFKVAQDHNKAAGQGYDFIDTLFNTMGGSGGNDAMP